MSAPFTRQIFTHYRYWLTIFALWLCASSIHASTITYTATDSVFANPERGFLHASETHSWGFAPLDENTLRSYRENEDITLIKRYFYLDNFVPNYYNLPTPVQPGYVPNSPYPEYTSVDSIPISDAYLQNMQADFDRLRAAGLKAVIRFAYTNKRMVPPFEDADLVHVAQHLEQLKPYLQANSDVIALVEAGFIGNWGEWFYTDHFTTDPANLGDIQPGDFAQRRALIEAILDAMPNHIVQVRSPRYKRDSFNAPNPLDPAQAHDGSDIARIGVHNDCWAAPFNPRGVDLVLRNVENGAVYRESLVGEDPRFWLAGQTQTLAHDLQTDVPAGNYELLLHFPDPAASLADRPEYAIRLANEDTWDASTGYNDLKHTLNVGGYTPYLPTFAPIAPVELVAGTELSTTITATDPNSTIPALSVPNLPPFASFVDHGDGTGTLTASPALGESANTFAIGIVATDADDATVTTTDTLSLTVQPAIAFAPPKSLLLYFGWPCVINGTYWNVDAASAEFGLYDYVVFGGSLEKDTHPNHAFTTSVIAHPSTAHTQAFGYIDLGTIYASNHSLTEIHTRIGEWQAMGIDGIFFDRADYFFGTSRQRQNDAIDYAHNLGLKVALSAAYPQDVFDSAVDATYNSTGDSSHIGTDDFYFYANHQLVSQGFETAANWQSKAEILKGYQNDLDFKVWSQTYTDAEHAYDEDAFFYAWHSALLYGHDATTWGEYLNNGGASGAVPYRTRPTLDAGTHFLSNLYSTAANVFERKTSSGTLIIDTNAHTASFVSDGAPKSATTTGELNSASKPSSPATSRPGATRSTGTRAIGPAASTSIACTLPRRCRRGK